MRNIFKNAEGGGNEMRLCNPSIFPNPCPAHDVLLHNGRIHRKDKNHLSCSTHDNLNC